MGRRRKDRITLHQEDDMKNTIEIAVNNYLDSNIGILVSKITETIVSIINIPLTVKQVSFITGISKQAVYKMVQRNTINNQKEKGTIIICLKDIQEMLLPKIRKAITKSV